MERSIETIWKEGFLTKDALVAPKLNDLYNQKSMNIVEKLIRMFKWNLIAVAIMAVACLFGYFLLGIPYLGLFLFVSLIAVAIVSQQQMKGMKMINTGLSSYEYLKAFDNWIKTAIENNTRFMRYFYPLFFLAANMTIWAAEDFDKVMDKLLVQFPDLYMVYGVPLLWVIGAIVGAGIMTYFGDQIYKFDVRLVYGRVFKKMDEIISDMEDLRSES